MLKLTDIKKDYKVASEYVHALKGVSLDFRKSEFVCILGPSGCGKTTLLNIIGGLDHYTSGDLVIQGKSTKDFTIGTYTATIGSDLSFSLITSFPIRRYSATWRSRSPLRA